MLITSIAKNEVFLINQTKTIEDKTSLSQLTNASVYSNDFQNMNRIVLLFPVYFAVLKIEEKVFDRHA